MKEMMEDLDYMEDEELEEELANRGVLAEDDLTPMRKSKAQEDGGETYSNIYGPWDEII